MFHFKMLMNLLLKRIEQADDYEVNEIIRTLIAWQKRKYPEYEMVIMSLPRYDLEERRKQIDYMGSMLKTYSHQAYDCMAEDCM